VPAAEAPAVETLGAADEGFPCAWRRIAGVPFCAPDPNAPAYAMQADLRELASALATTTDGTALPEAPTADDDRARYLAADRELVSRIASGHVLPAVDAYRLALRRGAGFFDAQRARLNLALIYRTLGFAAELRSVATDAGKDRVRPIIEGLAGDLAREQGALDRAREAYARATESGGAGACLGARGRAALALLDGRTAEASAELDQLPALCPAALRNDAETLQIEARRLIARGDARGALQLLERVRRAFGAAHEGTAIEDVAVASAAVGDTAGARAAYEQLAHGDFGPRLTEHGILGLARLDAAGGDTAGGFRRLEKLSPDTGSVERKRFATNALTDALHQGADDTAVSIVLEHGIAPSSLPIDDQIRLAHAMRRVGLNGEAQGLLRDLVRGGNGVGAADSLWEERGASALAADEPAQALAIADDWTRARGATTPAGALALRAQALGSLGQAAAADEALTRAVGMLDPIAARTLRLEVAARVRANDAALAARLAREALAEEHPPALSDAEAAAAQRLLGEAAEASGDDAGAIAAYSALTARYPTQPSADGAAYRLARLTAGTQGGAAARAAFAEIAHSRDPLERRMGAAAEAYETVVKPFENREAP
jgi:tetratricopeptide (TPR) repeat protein